MQTPNKVRGTTTAAADASPVRGKRPAPSDAYKKNKVPNKAVLDAVKLGVVDGVKLLDRG